MGLWSYEDSARLTQAVESLAEDAEPDPFQRVIGGIILAAGVALAGVAHFAAAADWPMFAWLFDLWHWRRPISLVGVGGLLCAAAIFLHAHYFWTPHPRWHAWGRIAKCLAAILIVALLLAVVIGAFARLV